ncbi:gliding motility lipoprotein GldB [Reichenbachiella versicolor]|uniref:gliding motility lipoprotein GldB n=1 Tax=Reichenbachiella versicolor TaxID=1821036 RepID=UPI0013A5B333|nr:DUF2268 domain-containing putative Zn-dependent protease [Reichenbachiella versicolor]
MKLSYITQFLAVITGIVVWSCGSDSCEVNDKYQSIPIDIPVERLEEQTRNFKTVDDVLLFLNRNRTMADFFLDAKQYPNDQILAKRMLPLFQEPSIDTLTNEALEYFKDLDVYVKQLEHAYQFVKYHYPETKVPRLQTMVSGLYNDLYISDSLIVVGLDYLIGMNGSFHPNNIPKYMVRRYMRESMAPIIMSFVSNEFNQIDQKHGTLLADMVNIGKSYYFVKQSMPCIPDSLIIGYTSEEMRLAKSNQEVIWANFIENELLYETDHFMKNKFVGEAPNVFEISEKCPGRIGAWIGWQIVNKYMEENDVTIQELMAETDAHKIFQMSKYKPKNTR